MKIPGKARLVYVMPPYLWRGYTDVQSLRMSLYDRTVLDVKAKKLREG